MIVEPMKPVDSWNIDDWRNAFNTLSKVYSDSAAYDYKIITAIANAVGAPPFDGSAPPDEWADAIIATAAALRAELDAMRAACAWRPGTERPLQDGLYLTEHYSYGESANDVNRYSAAAGWHCRSVPTYWLPIPPTEAGR